MVRKKSSERKTGKPRGRPFPKGHIGGIVKSQLLAASRRKGSVRGEDVAPSTESTNLGALEKGFHILKGGANIGFEKIPDENHQQDSPVELPLNVATAEKKDPENIDQIEFLYGENKLTLVLKRKYNRGYRIQIFLNGDMEIRPSTFVGENTALSFWNMLKASLNK